jgi:hypothetical protein
VTLLAWVLRGWLRVLHLRWDTTGQRWVQYGRGWTETVPEYVVVTFLGLSILGVLVAVGGVVAWAVR